MKQQIEKRTADGVKMLLETLTRNWYDTGTLLDEFEATHTEYERDQSRQYDALVAGHYALKDAIDSINNRLIKRDRQMRREIEVTKENREFLRRLFGVSEPTVYTALNLDKPETDVRKRIRKVAMERGGEVMVTLREIETIHDANNMMIQNFPHNGARIEINKLTGSGRILYKGEEVAAFENIKVSQIYDIQSVAYHLGKEAKERS